MHFLFCLVINIGKSYLFADTNLFCFDALAINLIPHVYGLLC